MYKVLLVDDNLEYAKSLTKELEEKGYESKHIADPISGIEEFAKNSYDLVISDDKMSHMDGIRFLATVKSIKPGIKCMLLTEETSTEEMEMAALDIYVDKVLSKNRSMNVLLRHIEQLLENTEIQVTESETRFTSAAENIVLDCNAHTVHKNGELVPLTRKEFDLLRLFLQSKGTALSREEIVDKLWTKEVEKVDIRIVDGHIKKLREKLKSFSITSVRGFGYKWNE